MFLDIITHKHMEHSDCKLTRDENSLALRVWDDGRGTGRHVSNTCRGEGIFTERAWRCFQGRKQMLPPIVWKEITFRAKDL